MKRSDRRQITSQDHVDCGFRFENFFVNQLVSAGAIEHRENLVSRFKLVLNAVKEGEIAGYYVDGIPAKRMAPRPPQARCANLTPIAAEVRTLAVDALLANGFLDERTWSYMRNAVQSFDFIELAPTLLRRVAVRHNVIDADKSMTLMDQVFQATANTNMVVEGGQLDQICREHRAHPLAAMVEAGFGAKTSMFVGRELGIVAMLHTHGLINEAQMVPIYDTALRAVTTYRGVDDLSPAAGSIITNSLRLKSKEQVKFLADATARIGNISLYGADSPWSDVCQKKDPPAVCKVIQAYPAAANYTVELVKHGLWDRNQATTAWEKVASLIPEVEYLSL